MYTDDEMKQKNIITSVRDFLNGYCVTKNGNTYNYYQRNHNGTWDNYDCKTRYSA